MCLNSLGLDLRKQYSMCQVLAVSRSGFYAWCARPISAREMANEALLVKIKDLFVLFLIESLI